MYENLSWIHDIHYRWGLPFCTPVSGAEFSMIRTPTTTLPPTPFLSFSHLSLHSFLLPHALPVKRCFIPHQVPFIPLQPFGLLSFHPSISQTLHLYFHPSACPSFTYSAPPPYHRRSEQGTVRLVRWEPAGPPPAVPPYVDLSPPVRYWFCFKQVKTTRRMRCRRWREIKKIGKGEREKKGKDHLFIKFMIWVQDVLKSLSGGYCTKGELRKKGRDEAELKRERVYREVWSFI